MRIGRVEHRPHMLALAAGKPHRRDCRGGISLQPLCEIRVAPGTRHNLGSVLGPDLVLVRIDNGIDRRRLYQTLLAEDGFQGSYPGRHGVQMIVVMVGIVGMRHGSNLAHLTFK